jgi:hypothetical protein
VLAAAAHWRPLIIPPASPDPSAKPATFEIGQPGGRRRQHLLTFE